MLDLLEKRAKKLKKGKFEAAQEVEQEMTDWKNNNFAEFRRPVTAYITLDSQRDKDRLDG